MAALRAFIGDDFMGGGVKVMLVRDVEGQRIMKAPGGVSQVIRHDDTAEPDLEPLRLTDEEARAILDSLNEGG